MTTADDDVDFSSFLVDLDDELSTASSSGSKNAFGGSSHGSSRKPSSTQSDLKDTFFTQALLSSSYPSTSLSSSPTFLPPYAGFANVDSSGTFMQGGWPSAAAASQALPRMPSYTSEAPQSIANFSQSMAPSQTTPKPLLAGLHDSQSSYAGRTASIDVPAASPALQASFGGVFSAGIPHNLTLTLGSTVQSSGQMSSSKPSTPVTSSLLSSSMPSPANWLQPLSNKADVSTQHVNAGVEPSSGPMASRAHRSRQASIHAPPSPAIGHSLPGQAIGHSSAVPLVHPYARPEGYGLHSPASTASVSQLKRPSKRRKEPSTSGMVMSAGSSAEHSTQSRPLAIRTGNLRQEARSATNSPTSSYVGSFGAASTQYGSRTFTAPNSAAASSACPSNHVTPESDLHGSLSAVSPQSGPLHADTTIQGKPSIASPGVDVDKAVALSGVGGRWYNWAAAQPTDPSKVSSVMSSVLGENDLFPPSGSTMATTPAATGPLSPGDHEKPTFLSRRERESSLAPTSSLLQNEDTPEAMAAKDPLSTHLWRLYAKSKAGLPDGARMENLTWRLMSLKLNKQKAQAAEEERLRTQTTTESSSASASQQAAAATVRHEMPAAAASDNESPDRGRKLRGPKFVTMA